LRARSRVPDAAFLLIAILGPFYHVVGLMTRRLSLFYSDFARLGLLYAVMGISGAIAVALLVKSRTNWVRLVAGIALLTNLGSIIFVASAWSRDMRVALIEAAMTPIEADKVGILICPTDKSGKAASEADAIEGQIRKALSETGLGAHIVVRRTYPVTSREQAQRLGERIGAQIIVWSAPNLSRSSTDLHVLTLGANETRIAIEPLSLMLFMATQQTFTVRDSLDSATGNNSPLATQVIAPVATAFGALAIGQPVFAAAQFQVVLSASAIPSQTWQLLQNYRGTALLLADRPDLALEAFTQARSVGEDSYSWVGIGNAAMARRDWHAATEAFHMAQALNPYSAMPYCGLGILFARENHVARAIANYQQAISLEPTWSAPYALLGLAQELAGNIAQAREAYQKCALLAGPNHGLQNAARQRAEQILRNPPTAVPTATIPPRPTPTPVPTLAVYRVQRGDTLRAIADKFGVPMDLIVEVNQMDSPDTLYIGQSLIIPAKPE
jgi:cytochrome c-type biogenesis protein CcmH/NrfG